MPDEIEIPAEDLHAKGDEVTLSPRNSDEALGALDALAQEEVGEQESDNVPPVEEEDTSLSGEKTPDEIAAEQKAAADKAQTEKAAAEKTPEQKLADEKAAADKTAADKAEAEKSADPLDKIELPPHTKAKSAEAFNLLKKTAKESQAVLRKELEVNSAKVLELTAELEKVKSTSGTVPEQVTAELEDLRKFKLAHDVQSDPAFREFDTTLKNNVETIYKKLEAGGMAKESIAKIKELGGPDAIDWEPVLPKLPIAIRRFVEATLVENERLRDKKETALAEATKNAEGFLKERSEREVNELTDTANSFLKGLPWTAEQKVPANATPEQKIQIEASNKLARETQTRLKEYFSDRSPARFAELAVGTAIAYKNKQDLDAVTAKLTAVEKDLGDKVTALTAERDKLQADLDKIRRAEAPRLRGDGTVLPAAKSVKTDLTQSGSEALDALAKEHVAAED